MTDLSTLILPADELKLFMSRMVNVQYVFRSGEYAEFHNHRFATSKPSQIKELEEVCNDGSEHYYIDPAKRTITIAEMAPDYELRKSIRAEIEAETRNMGQSSGPGGAGTGMGTTDSIRQLTPGINEALASTVLLTPAVSGSKGK